MGIALRADKRGDSNAQGDQRHYLRSNKYQRTVSLSIWASKTGLVCVGVEKYQ
jgi:hypothetical protein